MTAWAVSPDVVMSRVESTRQHRSASLWAGQAPKIPDSAIRDAAGGDMQTGLVAVDGHKAKKVWGVGVLEQPIERMWAAVNDDASKPRYGKLSYTEVLEGGLCGTDRVVFMYLPVPMMSDRYWVSNVKMNTAISKASGGEVREMTWETRDPVVPAGKRARDYMSDGMAIEFAKGAWYLTKIDATHTLVEYWTWTDPGGYIPAGLASSMAAGGVKETISSMGRLAADGPRCAIQ